MKRDELVASILASWEQGIRKPTVRAIAGKYVIGANKRNEAICLHTDGEGWDAGRVDGAVLREMFDEAKALGLERPLRVYGTTCQVGYGFQRKPSMIFYQQGGSRCG